MVDFNALAASPLLSSSAGASQDVDDNKYKRKSALEMLFRWGKTLVGPTSRRKRGSRAQRMLMIAFLCFVGFVTFVVIMSYLGRGGDYNDPMLEPLNNPNIHVGVD